MRNISKKQTVTAIAAIGAAAVFGMLSFGNSAQAAKYSNNCHLLNAAFGMTCCDRMTGSRLINVDASCHEKRKIVHKRKIRRPPPSLTEVTRVALPVEWVEGSRGGRTDSGKNGKEGESPNNPH